MLRQFIAQEPQSSLPSRLQSSRENVQDARLLKASVIINTYNRAAYLRNAVLSIARQSYQELELVVINGPSTDDTDQVLDALEAEGISMKRGRCPKRNLSESRNRGIALAAGDVVLFIDDDAVAHRDWVARLMARYADPRVGAAGGFTFDHTGVNFQCRYTVCDRFGNARYFDTLDPETALPGGADFYFPTLLGTNSSFSKSLLTRIGGFDEVFEYMLDETDVCARIIGSSSRVVTVPNAYVFHKYAPSSSRTQERIPMSLLAPSRSKAYFCFKHSPSGADLLMNLDVISELDRYRKDLDFSNRWLLDHKKISPAHYSRIVREVSTGIEEGMRLAASRLPSGSLSPGSQSLSQLIGRRAAEEAPPFNPLRRQHRQLRSLKLYLVSQGYPPADTAGIARWTHECAHQLAARGHEVHVITRSQTNSDHVDFCDGVWVHSVIDLFDEDIAYAAPVPLPGSIARRAAAVLKEIQRSTDIWGVDVVSAPIWDVEGILCAAHLRCPVITSLHTTYRLAEPFKPEWTTNPGYKTGHVDKVIAAETWLLEHSKSILANSQQIVGDINRQYADVLSKATDRVTTIPHGIGSPVDSVAAEDGDARGERHGRPLKVLFVGRLEERKGPDLLLSALTHMPALLERIEVSFVGSPVARGDSYGQKLARQIERLKRKAPRDRLRFLGYLGDAELEQHYRDADIFVAPSRFESFGLVLIEAMRFGTPVIASDVGGMREVITEGVEGFLVPVGDTVQLARRLRSLTEDARLRQTMGAAAQATYEARFTALRMIESLEAFYFSLAEEHCDE
jgi:glycosyltransferase involved in cell wall biosynthesis